MLITKHSDSLFNVCSCSHSFSLLQVNENGVVSFGDTWSYASPTPFPTVPVSASNKVVIAPFWSDNDIRLEGAVRYASYYYLDEGNEPAAELLVRVNEYITSFQTEEKTEFSGRWLLVAHWDNVHPYPHGDPGITNQGGLDEVNEVF